MLQARALEACHRADVEVVIKSGRREGSVLEDAKLIGSRSYIAEVGCLVVIDGERTELVGDAEVEEGKTLAETMVDRGIPDELFEHFGGPARVAQPLAPAARALAPLPRQGRHRTRRTGCSPTAATGA